MAELRVERVDRPAGALVHLRVPMYARETVATRLGLPASPSIWSGTDPEALWLAPDQWLLVARERDAASLVAWCESELEGLLHVASDASSALSLFRIEGPAGRDLLAMGSGVDFDASVFGERGCVRTRWMQAPVIVRRIGVDAYEMYVDATLADLVGRWIDYSSADAVAVCTGRTRSDTR